MIKLIDNFLNNITMYRLALWVLSLLATIAVVFSFLGVLPLRGGSLVLSLVVLLVICWTFNWLLARVFKVPRNIESAAITALILFFIMTPAASLVSLWPLVISGAGAILSKYILAWRGKHLFNPAAAGAVIAGFMGLGSSSWWISVPAMLPFVLIAGLLIVRKLRRFTMFGVFFMVAVATSVAYSAHLGLLERVGLGNLLAQAVLAWPLVFFGSVMLTEPLTTPPTKRHQVIYAALAGILFGLPLRVGSFFLTSEIALLIANLYSFAVSHKKNLSLPLREQRQLAPRIFEFIFNKPTEFKFSPGQYLEWTLPHRSADNRGVRRFFTIASSPTEADLRLGVKIIDQASSFKRSLLKLKPGDLIYAGQLAGDFIMPQDPGQPMVFMAGGIGITPFRGMIKYLLDTGQRRDIVLFYVSTEAQDFVYQDIFSQASQVGVKTIYLLSDEAQVPADWEGRIGLINRQMLEEEIPGFERRLYYLSGPPGLVDNYRRLLRSSGIRQKRIRTDYFPGY